MDIINFESFEDMTEFENSVKDLSTQQLKQEIAITLQKLKLNYIYLGDQYYSIKEINISNNMDEISRVYNRKRISFVSAMLSGCFKQRGLDFSLSWDKINKSFMESTGGAPMFVTTALRGKSVSFADKLTFLGCVAYKNYLMLVYDYLENKQYTFQSAVYNALRDEMGLDRKYNRRQFYTRYFLPKGINSASKNILKIKVLKKILKEKTAIEELKN